MPLLERDGLLDEMASRLRAAARGRGSVVLLGAEAGAGKTSVVLEFARRSGRSAHVLIGCCDPLTTPRPLSPLIDIALDPRSRLSGSFAASAAPYELFTAIQRRMADSDLPLVLVIEDVHWADEGTLDFLRFIGRRVESLPSLVVATYRDDEVGPQHPARPVIGELAARPVIGELAARPSATLLPVPPLSVEAVTELAGGDAALAARVHRVTDGNAFYVTEVLASGEEVPTTVREAVLARASRLSESARRLVQVVATAPRRPPGQGRGPLTPRQVEVLELIVPGLTNAEIAERLAITEKTAEHHVSAVLARLGAPNRASAVATAIGLGLVSRAGDAGELQA